MGNVRKSYTARDKLKIITYAEAHGNRAAGREYDGVIYSSFFSVVYLRFNN
jgi:hypothetical protein